MIIEEKTKEYREYDNSLDYNFRSLGAVSECQAQKAFLGKIAYYRLKSMLNWCF